MQGNETRGRPRDPLATDRIMAAALDEYARQGWWGFSMRGVAQAAGVGKSSLYLRWPSKEQLLVDSVVAGAAHLTTRVDSGSLRSDVIAWAIELFEYFLEPAGWTAVRIWVDAVAGASALDEIRSRVTEPIIETSSAIFRRAVLRGEMSEAVVALDVAECLFGCVLMHVMNMSQQGRHEARNHARDHVQPLVDIVLGGISTQAPRS
jgi:AcrR family transcriptional regulator